jgi:hypothetical protein
LSKEIDIVSFEEVQDCYVLRQVNQHVLNLNYTPYLIGGTDTTTGNTSLPSQSIQKIILSKRREEEKIQQKDRKMSRDEKR